MTDDLHALIEALKEIENHCPCGARPESPSTHPHNCGCPVERALYFANRLSERPAAISTSDGLRASRTDRGPDVGDLRARNHAPCRRFSRLFECALHLR